MSILNQDPNSSNDYSSFQKQSQARPPTPSVFNCEVSDDKQHVKITVGAGDIKLAAKGKVAGFRVYFAPISMCPTTANPTTDQWAQVFAGSNLVVQAGMSLQNPNVTVLNRQYCGSDGYFFGVSYNLQGDESYPTPGFRNPTASIWQGYVNTSGTGVTWISGNYFTQDFVGQAMTINGVVYTVSTVTNSTALTLTSSAGTQTNVPYFIGMQFTSKVPLDVTEVQASFTPILKGNTTVLQVTCSARPPNDPSFGGYQIYIQNYLNGDPGFYSYQEYNYFQNTAGSTNLLTGQFTILPDVPPIYSVGTCAVVNGSATVTAASGLTWQAGWASTRRITVLDEGNPPVYTDDSISSVTTTTLPMTLATTSTHTWTSSGAARYAIYQPSTLGSTVAPHPVKMLFVAISKTGTRRPDIQNSPYIIFPFGFSSSLSLPLNPVNLTASLQGVTVTLQWQQISTGATNADPTIDHFNVYRARESLYGAATLAFTGRGATPYATVKQDNNNASGGIYTFVDRNFGNDATNVSTYDFNPATPGQYTYYVTAVNVEGNENPLAWAGTVNTSTTAVTWQSGDKFTPDMAGQSINIAGTAYTVSSVTSATALVLTGSAGTQTAVYYLIPGVTAVAGAGVANVNVIFLNGILGNSGAESDPSIYRDNVFNRLYNSQFFAQHTATNTTIGLNNALNAAYSGGDQDATDFQIYWKAWDSQYKDSTAQIRTGLGGSNADAFTIWEKNVSGTGATATIPYVGTSVYPSGELQLDGGTASGYAAACQLISSAKFMTAENLCLAVTARQITLTGNQDQTFTLGVAQCDNTNNGGAGNALSYRTIFSGVYPAAQITTTPVRLSLITKLADASASYTGTYSFNGSTKVGTYVSGTNFYTQFPTSLYDLVLNPLLIDGATSDKVAGWGATTLTLTTNTPSAANHTITLSLFVDTILVFFTNSSQTNSNHMLMGISKPMLNGGNLPQNYTSQMNPLDWPGGKSQTGGGGNNNPPGPPCVVGSTILHTSDGLKKAEEIREGDKLLSWSNGAVSANVVERVYKTPITRTLKFNGMLECSEQHRIARMAGCRLHYVEAQKLLLGDRVIACDGFLQSLLLLESIEMFDHPAPIFVYDFALKSDPHNYIADGILCHNKPKYQEP